MIIRLCQYVKPTGEQKLKQSLHYPLCQFLNHCHWRTSRIYLLMKSQIRGLCLWVSALIESCSCQKKLKDVSNVVGIFFMVALLPPIGTSEYITKLFIC